MKALTWVILGCSAFFATPLSADELNAKQIDLLHQLASRQFFKDATCAEFTNSILQDQTFPVIGKIAPAPVLRNTVDRRHEGDRLPILVDGATIREKPYLDVEIATDSPDGRKQWTLELSRKLDVLPPEEPKIHGATRLETNTTYVFAVEEKRNRPDCELQKIVYDARSKATGLNFHQEYTTQTCLDLFLDEASQPLPTRILGRKALSLAQKDCAVGVHYFSEAKRILTAKKHF